MDVLKPQLVWIEGRCYRIFESSAWSTDREISTYVEDNYEEVYEDEECCIADIEIVPYGATRFKHSFHVAKPFFPFIIGAKNAVRKRLESETNTTIQIPKPGQDGDIVIIGRDKAGVASARHRIDLIIEASRKKVRPTHFLSIPLNDGHVIMKFNDFKSQVLNNPEITSTGIDETIFQTPSKFHLTLGMLVLLDDIERQKAVEALNHCKNHIIKSVLEKYGPISIRLCGVDIMNDDPHEVNVLYANVANREDGLQELSEKVVEYFASIGLFHEKSTNKLSPKLHATLMNIKFKYNEEELQALQRNDKFDASIIMEAHKDTFFGEIPLKQIHISQRHTIGSNGYYQATAKIDVSIE